VKLLTEVIRPEKLDDAMAAVTDARVGGLTVTEVRGFGKQYGHIDPADRLAERRVLILPKLRLDLVVRDEAAESVARAIAKAVGVGEVGDGKIWVRQAEDGLIEFACDLPHADSDPTWKPYLEAVDRREGHADVASLRHVFQPGSVAVVGASRRPGTVGRAILHNIVTGGYQGQVYAVSPHALHMEGVPCLPSVTALPEPADLAVVAVPPAAVPAVADECGRRGVKAMVVITSGLDSLQGADLLAACRRYGMRLVGPNCFGVAVPGIGLDATFAARHPAPGRVGLVMQSGGLGFALVDRLSRLGLGISSFASVGNKYDVSSNDLLTWWEQDGTTELAVLYIESFGNPRKFARTARRLGARMPVLAVQAGRSAIGQQAAASHTAAAVTPLVTREALFEQAGVIATDSLGELLDAAALLASQPVPAGRSIAMISNIGGAGVLTRAWTRSSPSCCPPLQRGISSPRSAPRT
jgi:succinyl-CoA synthetase alpha subunit/nitrogen regulatory protein PII